MITLEWLGELTGRYQDDLKAKVEGFELRGHRFGGDAEIQLMGVINLSPDSWYRESVCLNVEQAVRRGRRLKEEGAALVDVGAESTLLHAGIVDKKKQQELLLPVIERLKNSEVLVSVETYHKEVAEVALKEGAAVLNLTGTSRTEEIYDLVACHDAGVIICYVQGENVRKVENFAKKEDPLEMLEAYFSREIQKAKKAGVRRIWLDPGLGFYYRNFEDGAQRVRYQTETFLQSFRLRKLGWPICHALPHAFEYFGEEVRSAESFFAVWALLGKAGLLRTHEVAKVRSVVEAMASF